MLESLHVPPLENEFEAPRQLDQIQLGFFPGREHQLIAGREHQRITGREHQLRELNEHCARNGNAKSSNCVLIQGRAGMGKSHLALEYAHRHCGDYSTIFWIDAADAWSIHASFVRVAQGLLDHYASRNKESDRSFSRASFYLGLEDSIDDDGRVSFRERTGSTVTEAVTRWMTRARNNRWLVIFDNYDSPHIEEFVYLKNSSSGTIIATSRSQNSRDFDSALCLDAEPEDDVMKAPTLYHDFQIESQHSDVENVATLKDLLQRLESSTGENSPQALAALEDLASVYQDTGDMEAYQLCLQRQLLALDALHKPTSSLILRIMKRLIAVCEPRGHHDRAERLLIRLLRIQRTRLGEDHPEVLKITSSLAILVDQQTRYEESRPLFEKAISGFTRVLGDQHPITLNTCENLALSHHMQGNYDEAIQRLSHILKARREARGPRPDPDLKRTQERISAMVKERHEMTEASCVGARLHEKSGTDMYTC